MPNRSYRRRLIAIACAASCVSGATWAQEASPQKIEVTGSRIKRIDAEGASPVQVLKREDIERTGATTVREMLDTLSSASTGGTLDDLSGGGAFSPGASSASLRNLGKQSTLVLLNSRRLSAYPLADYNEVFSNIDSLPMEAIDRVEVLKSGGSALYGSDAVAGVINIITRSSYQGGQLNLSAQQSVTNGQFQSQRAALTGGFGSLSADRYNLLANLEIYHREGFFWPSVLGDVNPAYARISPGFGTFSTYSFPGNVMGIGPVEGCENVVANLCMYNRYERFEAVPETDRANLLLSGRVELGDGTSVFGEALYSHVKAVYQRAYSAYGRSLGPSIWGDPQTAQLKFFYPRGLPAGHPLNPTGDEVEFRYRFADAPAEHHPTTDEYRVLAGVQGNWSDFDWELAAGVMGGHTSEMGHGSYSESGFKQMIGDYTQDQLPADFFNKPGGYRIGQRNSDEVLDVLFPEYGYTGQTQQTFVDGKVSGDVGRWAAGNVGLATGFELRHEKSSITPSPLLAQGDIVGNGISESDASRNFGAVFAELSLPLHKTLEAQVAGRLDHFPGFPTHFSPKLGLRYQPMPELLLRGTYEGGFRAPNLTESAKSLKFAFTSVDDPKRCPAAVALATDLRDQADALPDTDPNKAVLLARADSVLGAECGTGVALTTANNPDLKPETSRSFTLGLGFQPAPHWGVTLDYWRIERKDEINQRSIQDLLAVEDSLPANVLERDTLANDTTFTAAERAQYGVAVGPLLVAHGMFENLARTKTAGIDMSVKGEVASPLGPVSLDVDAAYTQNYQVWNTARGGYGDNLAGRYAYPRWVIHLAASLKSGAFDHSLRTVWHSSTSLQGDFDDTNWSPQGCADNGIDAADCRIAEYSRWDYSLSYSGFAGVTLGLNVFNVFKQRPPVDRRAFGLGGIIPPSTEDAQGRMLRVWANYRF